MIADVFRLRAMFLPQWFEFATQEKRNIFEFIVYYIM